MFSVIIPLYNKGPFIHRAIDSVLNQEFKEYEIIVVNDGSTDGGENLVKETYSQKVYLINQANSGVSAARNLGIHHAQFPWIAFLDADDYWHPKYLLLMAQAISENPEVGIFGANYDSFNLAESPKLKYFLFKGYFKQAVRNTYFFTSATIVKRIFFEKKPGFDPQFKLGEDIDVWLRASLFFGDGIYVQNTLVYYGSEDVQRATQQSYLLENTLIPKILEERYYEDSLEKSNCSRLNFLDFRDKWIYFTLFSHYKLAENRKAIQEVLDKMESRFLLVRIFYMLPFTLLHQLFLNRTFSKGFRNYIKFCFRYIYR
ncbi:glycosyltransferase family 2 protein [Litoribacter alkaliphilus]|uniref:Glycosyltransferase family 2 protein n=1 Tax=Litoribacter ruber TaxID=702568 RepID=A0AAP2CN46_9BACT|nr:glycosyltransferase family A protein [Litoribacter alkaliphilus]MBS9525600.1 glycosyltransferase family 2 protein [Litoribacter alkaliphilus]